MGFQTGGRHQKPRPHLGGVQNLYANHCHQGIEYLIIHIMINNCPDMSKTLGDKTLNVNGFFSEFSALVLCFDVYACMSVYHYQCVCAHTCVCVCVCACMHVCVGQGLNYTLHII